MSFNGELLEIFSWMPAKYLCKFSSVCKTNSQLLTNDFFARKQFKNMQLLEDTDYFIEPQYCQSYASCMLDQRALSSGKSSLPPKTIKFLAKTSHILASSNGLLCCRNFNDVDNPLFLFNPTTMSHLSVPNPDERLSVDKDFNIIFQCDKNEDSVGYLLMAILSPEDWGAKFHSMIYSPVEKIWKHGGRVDLGARGMNFKSAVHLNGVVYMVSNTSNYLAKAHPLYWPYIVEYEIKTSSSWFVQIPREARKGLESSALSIFKWGKPDSSFETICLVRLLKNVFTVWELAHDGCSYYWIRVFKMRAKVMVLQHEASNDLKVTGFSVMSGSVLLFATREKVYSYDLNSEERNAEFECVHDYGESVCFTSFSSTLRPSGHGAKMLTLS